jgi:hypothetical protein
MSEILPTKEQIGAWVWENRDWITGKVKDLYAWIRGTGKYAKKSGILILGGGRRRKNHGGASPGAAKFSGGLKLL